MRGHIVQGGTIPHAVRIRRWRGKRAPSMTVDIDRPCLTGLIQ